MADKIEYTGAPEIGPTIHPSGGVTVHADPDAFGANMFRALHGLGEAGEEAALRKQALINDIDHNTMALDMSQKFGEEWTKMGSKEGRAAQDYLPTYQANLKKLYNDAVTNAPNDAIRGKLASSMFRDVDRWMNHGANYAETQLRQAQKEVHTRALEQNINAVEMMRNQPIPDILSQIEHGTGGVGGIDSVRERLLAHGLDTHTPDGKEIPENIATYKAEEAKQWGAAAGPLIDTLSENWENGPQGRADLRKAEELFKQTRDKMDARTANFLEKKLQPRLDKAAVAETADRLKPIPDESGYIPTTAAGQRRAMLYSAPTKANARAMGLSPEVTPGEKHPSDFFTHLERGKAGIDYINTKDTDGSHSYGSMGLNSRGGETSSANRFAKENPKLGLKGTPGSPEFDKSWKDAAANKPDELRAAEKKWWADHYLNPVSFKLKEAGIPPSIADNRLVQLYLADRSDQHGEHILDKRTGNPHQVTHIERMQEAAQKANGDPHKFIDAVRASDVAHLQDDFGHGEHSALRTGAYSPTSHQNRLNGRMEAARQALAYEQGPNAPAAQPSPHADLLAPGGVSRASMRENNLIEAKKAFPDNPIRQHMLATELNRRSVIEKNNLSGERQRIDDIMKNYDLQASKGLPGLTLEKYGISEDQIRAAYRDKPWKAEHIIESAHLQSQNADKMSSMKFAPKEEWDALLRDTNQGLGIDTMIQMHRKKEGTLSAFDVGADPEAHGDIMNHHFALQEKIAATVRKAYSEHFEEINKDPANFLLTSKNPAVQKALKTVEAAKGADRADAFRNYASIMKANQESIGVPEGSTRILTNLKADTIVSDFMKSENPKRDLETLRETYGDQFKPIFRELVTYGKMPVKFEALLDLDNQNANLLAGRIKAEAAEKGNEHRHQIETLLGENRGKIAKAVRDDDSTKQWMLSLEHMGVSDPIRANAMNTVDMLAEARFQHFGEPASTAASEAVRAFTKGYKFTDDHIAIPASKYEAVMSEANDHLKFLDGKNIIVPSYLKDTHDGEAYANYVKTTRNWKPTPDGDGMYLIDHEGNPVMTTSRGEEPREEYDDKTGKKVVIPGRPGKTDLIKVMFDNPKKSISNASPYAAAPSLFFEGLGD